MAQYIEFWKRYLDFSGVSDRKAYWIPMAINGIFGLCAFLGMIRLEDGGISAGAVVMICAATLYFMAAIIPSLAVQVRRLHDSNRSGLWLLATCVPVVGDATLLWFSLSPTIREGNRYR